ncbi:ogr/Delta-like zinc finger family protein [Desulfocurvibacter africanus]|uniref:ogr/Delta-like zinc finger family protein n=1 Tax=Desulfocurvibacter africanus TaxID=873 RepID=UPI002FD8A959
MRISCDRCRSKARIATTREITPRLRKLYCACTNVECGHTFVMHLEFGHTISPSALDLPEATREALRDCASPAQAQLILAG